MSDTVIKVENLGKKYLIRHQQSERYVALRDVVSNKFRSFGKRLISLQPRSSNLQPSREDFWALKDLSFEVKQGDRIGIIGRNGAGKTTLLKLLSRITEPTTGRIAIKGRVASLLEVGTGFHPELTGRENIFLNGAILGMTKAEIKRKFGEIVEFAEVEKFLDTPVKRYSGGMYVRLAFAVAAHLDPEILLVDEVLAVGDAAFQKKCLGKMEEAGEKGRTVLYVSHNMQAIRQLCSNAIMLQAGQIAKQGSATSVVEAYLEEIPRGWSLENLRNMIQQLPSDPVFGLKSVEFYQNGKLVFDTVGNGSPLEIVISYNVLKRTTGLRVFIDLCDIEGTLLFRSFHDEDNDSIPTIEPGVYVSKAVIPENFLAPVQYELRVQAGIHNVRMCTPPFGLSIPITIKSTGKYNRAYPGDTQPGKLALVISWQTSHGNSMPI
jgi:lipopolysaccharide transport system ATP-binding protein